MSIRRRVLSWLRSVLARYEGASYSPNRRYLQAAVQSARFDAGQATRTELVRRSRYFEKNSALYNRLADIFESYTVGTGLVVVPNSSSPEWNAVAGAWLAKWGQFPDLVSRQEWGTLQGLMARAWFVDGEVFCLFTKGKGGFPRLQAVESHLVKTPENLREQEGKSICEGIEVDGVGRPSGYYIAADSPNGLTQTFTRHDAGSVLHLFEPGRPGQMRGLPFVYPVLNDLHDLDDLQILEMQSAKDHARVARTIKAASGEIDAETIATTGGIPEQASTDRQQYYESVLGSGISVLQPGDEMQMIASARPSVVTQDYWRYLEQKVCMGIGIPYILAHPESMQGTVFRGALDVAAAYFRARSAVMASACQRIWVYVMGTAAAIDPEIARGRPEDWTRVSIRPPRAVNVDVGRNSAAMLAELEAGATNYEMIYGPLGLDWREELRRKAEQVAFIVSLATEHKIAPSQIAAFVEEPEGDSETSPIPNE